MRFVSKLFVKPVVKWAGGKTKLLNQLSRYLPAAFNNYHEPFLGGGALFFYLFPEIKKRNARAYLSDSVEELINLYKVIKNQVEELITISKKHIYDQKYYYEIRSLNPAQLSDLQRASRMLYLNKTCFNGLYRVNSKGQFNVSFGDYTDPVIVNSEALRNASIAFQSTQLAAGDFEQVLDNAGAGDFVYLDPPYVPLSATSNFTGYTAGSFSMADHRRLREVFETLSAMGCYVMLSNSNTDFTRELFQGCNIKTINALRAINSDVRKRGSIKELVILSYPDRDMFGAGQTCQELSI
ncbi:Modification methylase DpnIIA [Pelotomaculum propionicicum]|uniref:Site-specific DNA-methyltransferase (adenine-specific) n=1 Tax=Pelotomaculum propionicicum TaxID=258475 RepID=A0A4Y7RVD5_9FIRM|nr:Modification methylase DpnIIA [Pelotomaculum propionicicum]